MRPLFELFVFFVAQDESFRAAGGEVAVSSGHDPGRGVKKLPKEKSEP